MLLGWRMLLLLAACTGCAMASDVFASSSNVYKLFSMEKSMAKYIRVRVSPQQSLII
jgi:hypothetical protein